MTQPGRLQHDALRKLYAKAHQQLQEAGLTILRLRDRITELEAENARLHALSPYSHGDPNADG